MLSNKLPIYISVKGNVWVIISWAKYNDLKAKITIIISVINEL